jgi:5-methylcytosine-specific restriction endonuclease McrA
MRHIKLTQLLKLAKVDDLKAAHTKIATLSDKERSDFIDNKKNQKLWTSISPALWLLGHMKCWYSEAEISEGEGHVDHFRPKKAVHGLKGQKHSGYWWRAFDWNNYRLAHSICNVRRKDYLTDMASGKGAYFPLKDGTVRASCLKEEINETPVLLDPVVASDCKLIAFDSYDGAAIPRYSATDDEWLHFRADQSINYYHLNDGKWNTNRKDLMDGISRLCEVLIAAESAENKDPILCENLMNELTNYISPHQPFSAACLQVIKEHGLVEKVI